MRKRIFLIEKKIEVVQCFNETNKNTLIEGKHITENKFIHIKVVLIHRKSILSYAKEFSFSSPFFKQKEHKDKSNILTTKNTINNKLLKLVVIFCNKISKTEIIKDGKKNNIHDQ